MNRKREAKLNLNMCTDTVISLYRERFYAGYAKFSSLYREYRCIEDRYIGVLSHTFNCNFCQDIAYSSLYRGYRYIGVPLYVCPGMSDNEDSQQILSMLKLSVSIDEWQHS